MINKILLIIFSLFILYSCNSADKSEQISARDVATDREVIGKSVTNNDKRKIQTAASLKEEIKAIEAKLIEAEQNEDHNKKGIYFMQLANIHHEKSQDLRAAIFNCQRSISSFAIVQDTSQMANMLKYQASLLAANLQFDDAIATADRALHYYNELDFDRGRASIYLNKSQTYLAQKDYTSSEVFYLHAVKILKEAQNVNSLFLYQLQGLKLYKESGQKSKFKALVEECSTLTNAEKIRPNLLNQFESIIVTKK